MRQCPGCWRLVEGAESTCEVCGAAIPAAVYDNVERALAASQPTATPKSGLVTGLAAAAALVFKFKTVILLALGKLKFLALGLSKLPTLLSMFATVGVYTLFWGWPFALGFVLCIYVHEIGHVVALRQLGIPASPPMFIPGFGAYVRMKEYPANEWQNARVGMAGPIWGAGAAIVASALGFGLASDMLLAIGGTAAVINLFNLIPIGSLDGGRAYSGMTRLQRGIVTGALLVSWAATGSPFTLIVGAVMGGRTIFQKTAPEKGDLHTTVWFCVLAAGLSALAETTPARPI